MKRWRRPLILIALLLLAGAVLNVGVAWGIAALGPKPPVQIFLTTALPFDFSSGESPEIPPLTVRLGDQKGSRGHKHWHERGDAHGLEERQATSGKEAVPLRAARSAVSPRSGPGVY